MSIYIEMRYEKLKGKKLRSAKLRYYVFHEKQKHVHCNIIVKFVSLFNKCFLELKSQILFESRSVIT